tara:strand:+ start:1149 stop:1994 length:846 start_codon:yes stop_codon:yes gene_type:complete
MDTDKIKQHFLNHSRNVSSWWAEGTYEDGKKFQGIGKNAICHAGLFGRHNSTLMEPDPSRPYNPKKLRDNIKWDFLASNIFVGPDIVASPEVAWEFVNYLTSKESPWYDIINTGYEILDDGKYPIAIVFNNGELLSKIPPPLIFNFLTMARVGTKDNPDVPVSWSRFVEAGIHPTLALLAAIRVQFSEGNLKNQIYNSNHCSFNELTPISKVMKHEYKCGFTDMGYSHVWGASNYESNDRFDTLCLRSSEVYTKKTRFSAVQLGKVEAYIERLGRIQNEVH